MFSLLFLPFRLMLWLVLGVVLLPFFFLRVLFKLLAFAIVLPIVGVVMLAVAVVMGLAFFLVVLIPAIPFVGLALFVGLLISLSKRTVLPI